SGALREWEAGNTEQARRRLDSCRWDLRGWEHRYLQTLFTARQAVLNGHTAAVLSVACSPDGTRLASTGHDLTTRVWDAQTGKELLRLERHNRPVTAVAFRPDGQRLATGSNDKTVKLWNMKGGLEAS